MKRVFGILVFLFAIAGNAQKRITGIVLDGQNESAIAGASVFLSNTSVGTVTSSDGRFELSVPAGSYDLVVSSIGYETSNQPIGAASANHITIKLSPKAKELETVVVAPFERDGWVKWGKFFIENFIGTSAEAKNCILKNKETLRFRHSKKAGEVAAIAFEPLIIQNKTLGYTIRYQLEAFTYNFNTDLLLFQGYPFFEPMQGNAARQKRWTQNRKIAYEGSLLHFMRSVYRNKIGEAGFEVQALQKKANTERRRIDRLYKIKSHEQLYANADSAAYYEKVLAQPAQFDIVAKPLLPGDSIAYALDSVTAALDFKNYLLVTYTSKLAPPEYRQQVRNGGSAMASQLFLMHDTPIAIQANGNYIDPANLLSIGYWSWREKVATLLPFDYKPN